MTTFTVVSYGTTEAFASIIFNNLNIVMKFCNSDDRCRFRRHDLFSIWKNLKSVGMLFADNSTGIHGDSAFGVQYPGSYCRKRLIDCRVEVNNQKSILAKYF